MSGSSESRRHGGDLSEATGSFLNQRDLKVLFGAGSVAGVKDEVERFGGRRVLLVTTSSLARDETVTPRLLRALDGLEVEVFGGAKAHSPLSCVREAAEVARETKADVLVSLGGGSAVDVAKGVSMVLTGEPIEGFKKRAVASGQRPIDAFFGDETAAGIPTIAVTTTLSGAEFTGQAGLTDDDRHDKDQYYFRPCAPRTVVLDREMTESTPSHLWLTSGVKCLDHNIERLYSVHNQPFSEALETASVRTIFEQLGGGDDHAAHPARTHLLMASWMVMHSTGNVNVGLGHAIGHQLAPLADIGHGESAAVMLPHVMRFNAEAARRVLADVARHTFSVAPDASDEDAVSALIARVEDLVARLGLPTRLRDLGVDRSALPLVAERSIDDTAITGNPRPVKDPREVLEVLEAAW